MVSRFLAPILACVALVAATPAAKAKAPSRAHAASTAPRQDTVHLGGGVLSLEIADTDSLRTQGLSDRRSMDWQSGMLFVFPNAERRAFWMIDCHFDLDIAYISPDGTIRDIQTMIVEPGVPPNQLANYPSRSGDVMYALEVNRGWFASKGVRVGQKIPGVLRHTTKR